MKQYIHNPEIFRRHYKAQIGRALPGFSGSRMQHGEGIGTFLGSLARKALPLISSGLKIVKPHIKKAAKNVAKDLTTQAATMAMNKFANAASKPSAQRRRKPKQRKRKQAIRRKKVKGATSNDIF